MLSPNDSLALGYRAVAGVARLQPGQNWPIITGQDADLANTKKHPGW